MDKNIYAVFIYKDKSQTVVVPDAYLKTETDGSGQSAVVCAWPTECTTISNFKKIIKKFPTGNKEWRYYPGKLMGYSLPLEEAEKRAMKVRDQVKKKLAEKNSRDVIQNVSSIDVEILSTDSELAKGRAKKPKIPFSPGHSYGRGKSITREKLPIPPQVAKRTTLSEISPFLRETEGSSATKAVATISTESLPCSSGEFMVTSPIKTTSKLINPRVLCKKNLMLSVEQGDSRQGITLKPNEVAHREMRHVPTQQEVCLKVVMDLLVKIDLKLDNFIDEMAKIKKQANDNIRTTSESTTSIDFQSLGFPMTSIDEFNSVCARLETESDYRKTIVHALKLKLQKFRYRGDNIDQIYKDCINTLLAGLIFAPSLSMLLSKCGQRNKPGIKNKEITKVILESVNKAGIASKEATLKDVEHSLGEYFRLAPRRFNRQGAIHLKATGQRDVINCDSKNINLKSSKKRPLDRSPPMTPMTRRKRKIQKENVEEPASVLSSSDDESMDISSSDVEFDPLVEQEDDLTEEEEEEKIDKCEDDFDEENQDDDDEDGKDEENTGDETFDMDS